MPIKTGVGNDGVCLRRVFVCGLCQASPVSGSSLVRAPFPGSSMFAIDVLFHDPTTGTDKHLVREFDLLHAAL